MNAIKFSFFNIFFFFSLIFTSKHIDASTQEFECYLDNNQAECHICNNEFVPIVCSGEIIVQTESGESIIKIFPSTTLNPQELVTITISSKNPSDSFKKVETKIYCQKK